METTLPPEYRERVGRFLREAEEKIFPKLQREGFFCSGVSMADIRAETLRHEDLPAGLDQPDEELQVLLDHRRRTEELNAEARAKGVDHAELLITGPSGKRLMLDATRPDFLRIAVSFGGKEQVWIIREDPSFAARLKEEGVNIDVAPDKETEIALLASYLFEG